LSAISKKGSLYNFIPALLCRDYQARSIKKGIAYVVNNEGDLFEGATEGNLIITQSTPIWATELRKALVMQVRTKIAPSLHLMGTWVAKNTLWQNHAPHFV